MWFRMSLCCFSSGGPRPRGAAEAAAGGEDLQGVHGQAGVHRLHPLRSPGGVRRLRGQPAPLPHLQGRHQRQRSRVHVLVGGGSAPPCGRRQPRRCCMTGSHFPLCTRSMSPELIKKTDRHCIVLQMSPRLMNFPFLRYEPCLACEQISHLITIEAHSISFLHFFFY